MNEINNKIGYLETINNEKEVQIIFQEEKIKQYKNR